MTSVTAPASSTGSRTFRTIGVIGLGTMGAGIGEVFARNGFDVIGVEVGEDALERGRQHLEHSTGRAVKRGKMTEAEQAELIGRITFSTSLKDLHDADFVVEAVVESLEVKKEIFRQLDEIVAPDAILATNTSSLSVTEISTANARPGRVIGVHFFNPAPVQNLVEIVRTVVTEPDVLADVQELVGTLGKNPVVCGDKAGFIANTLLFGYLNHAVAMYEGHYASREDIDAAMRFGCGYPMGPLALLDLIGLDTAYEILDTMYKQGRDRLHAPAPLLKQYVTAGLLGRKSGRGFYTYEAPDSPVVVADAHTPSADDAPAAAPRHQRVGVVGTGTMASGIVEVFAKAGYDVLYVGRAKDKVDGVVATITRNFDKQIQRGKATEDDKVGVLGRVAGSTSLDDLKDVDLVVEAIAEDLDVKTTLFENLDEICKPGAILATTTSSLPIISLARATSRPQDVVGMHFFNPATIMKLVEVVSTVCDRRGRHRDRPRAVRRGRQGGREVRRPRRLHRQRAALPLPQRRGEDARGPLRDGRRHRHRHEAGLRAADGALRAARRGRERRVAGHPARALPRVPRAGLRAGATARAPGHRRLPRPQDQARVPRLLHALTPGAHHRSRSRSRREGRSGSSSSTVAATSSPSGSRVERRQALDLGHPRVEGRQVADLQHLLAVEQGERRTHDRPVGVGVGAVLRRGAHQDATAGEGEGVGDGEPDPTGLAEVVAAHRPDRDPGRVAGAARSRQKGGRVDVDAGGRRRRPTAARAGTTAGPRRRGRRPRGSSWSAADAERGRDGVVERRQVATTYDASASATQR